MQTKSLWTESVPQTEFSALTNYFDVDVAIVGGGITGLTAAILLQRAGKHVAVIDNAQIAKGESGYTTAHLTQVLDNRYHQLISDFGEDQARLVAASKRAAIDCIEALTADYRIACGFEHVPGFLYSENDTAGDLAQEAEAMGKVKISAELLPAAPLPFKTKQAIRIDNQGQFHPRQYMLALAAEIVRKDGHIFEHTRVTHVEDGTPCRVEFDRGHITARHVIIAANVPVTNWLFLNTKISAYRTYALGAKLRTPLQPGLYWDTADPYHYIRTYRDPSEGDILIVGGEDHKTGTKEDTVTCFEKLELYARAHFDIGAVPYYWSGQIIKPLDGLPYIGLNSLSKHVYVSTGYNGNGMTFGTLGAMLLTDLILERPSEWAALYTATRLHPLASIGNFIAENKDVPLHMIGDRLAHGDVQTTDEIQPNEGKLISVEGHKVAAYRDAEGSLHACSAVCPHMGGIVHWNSAESSWDCPCHGSRFTAQGKMTNGPAVSDLKPVSVPEPAAAR
ncbi:MAG TPA: FAD-dependent oxidoreductase [Planctomycetota bacterium]|jgi:glycine/D-amino acid oxidase-like deaminating enzyme/nitrite reductase/ring-hydroxylating ferredoxin subunit